ncbi:uncharacterized protein LOC128324545 [Hemicordylus capensis]|uniref:uncharacterized protein LOC128324545 n=1 Tax=Hemicordylus capensis TaxID=884348 RepID=UPI0023021D69|nr:uncharacterized protein LOC128324545 [Hemicordylus capensis]XP_053105211.1 uncharacterized protein LOC128324545 [Hemicordylus capensis]XP_053105212.1 uncharacterized protein LOC128324545 [Hemicordylus capensis]
MVCDDVIHPNSRRQTCERLKHKGANLSGWLSLLEAENTRPTPALVDLPPERDSSVPKPSAPGAEGGTPVDVGAGLWMPMRQARVLILNCFLGPQVGASIQLGNRAWLGAMGIDLLDWSLRHHTGLDSLLVRDRQKKQHPEHVLRKYINTLSVHESFVSTHTMVIRCHRSMKNFHSNNHHHNCHLFMMCKRIHTQDCQLFFSTKYDTPLLGTPFLINLSSPEVNTAELRQEASCDASRVLTGCRAPAVPSWTSCKLLGENMAYFLSFSLA